MAEEIAYENGRISNFKGHVTLTLYRVILHTVVRSGVTAYRQGWTKSRGPKVLGAPEQCSKKFNMDVSRNSRYVSLN